MAKAIRSARHRVFTLNYHFTFCPKYRRKCLVGDIATRCEELIREKCGQLNADVITLEVMPDHVHLFVAALPDIAPNQIVAQVKGYASHELRKEFPELLKMPSLWTRAFYVGSVGHTSDSVVKSYIENQKGK